MSSLAFRNETELISYLHLIQFSHPKGRTISPPISMWLGDLKATRVKREETSPVITIQFVNEPDLSGKKLVKAVRADLCTVDSFRGLYARVCVEVDFKFKKSSQFCLNDDIEGVEYEGLHLICFWVWGIWTPDRALSEAKPDWCRKLTGGEGGSPKPGSASRVGTKAFRTLDATSQQTSQEDHVVSLRIRDHKIANTQKEKEGC